MFLSTVPQIDISKIKDFCAALWRFCNQAYFYVFKMPIIPFTDSLIPGINLWTFFNPFSGVEEAIVVPHVPNIFGLFGKEFYSLFESFGIDLSLTVFDFICGTGVIVIIIVGVFRWLLDILP